MKNRLNIMIDMDGVMADFWWGFTEIATTMGLLEKPISTVDQKAYDSGFSPKDKNAIWDVIKASGSYWLNLPPLVTVQDSLHLASMEKDTNLYFVTARVGHRCKQQTEIFLARMGIYAPTVILVKHRDSLPSPRAHILKHAMAMAMGIDYSIEDKLENCREIGEVSGCQSYLLTQPYNEEAEWGLRVTTLGDFLKKIEGDARWQ